jgi:hypothetical protein
VQRLGHVCQIGPISGVVEELCAGVQGAAAAAAGSAAAAPKVSTSYP